MIRTATSNDLAACLALSEQAGWNQVEADWRRLFRLNPTGCFVLEEGGRVAGTVATTVFGDVAWVSMVLVDRDCRGRGHGGTLVRHAVEHVVANGATSVRLDATPMGRPLYEKLGFAPDYEVIRFVGRPAVSSTVQATTIHDVERLDKVVELDRRVTATDRSCLLALLCDGADGKAVVAVADDRVVGYAAWRPGRTGWQVGPAVAFDDAVGRTLLQGIASRLPDRPWILDVPVPSAGAAAWAVEAGLVEQRRLLRMTRGRRLSDRPQDIWASSGPEKG